MKIKNEKELFDLFIDKNHYKEHLRHPFLDEIDGRVWASDLYVAIMINPACLVKGFERWGKVRCRREE